VERGGKNDIAMMRKIEGCRWLLYLLVTFPAGYFFCWLLFLLVTFSPGYIF
jgi:hypothetical protein